MNYINLDNLDRLCKGDKSKRIKYLQQYLELIPSSVVRIEIALQDLNRSALAKEIHYIKPQLIFFGMDEKSLGHIKNEPKVSLEPWIDNLLVEIKNSILEIEIILKNIELNN